MSMIHPLVRGTVGVVFIFLLGACAARTPTEPNETIPDPPPVLTEVRDYPVLSLTFAGDIMAHDVNYNRTPYNKIYRDITRFLIEDDLSFANLEFPVQASIPMANYPLFNIHPSYVEAAIESGFDVFSVANNHITDQGKEGVTATYAALQHLKQQHGISFSGIRPSESYVFEPELITIADWKIGFLAVTGFLNNYWAEELVHIVPFRTCSQHPRFFESITRWSRQVDLFILSFHGGLEYTGVPHQQKIEFFEKLLDAGVHIVWSHHPHVLQPWFLERRGDVAKLMLCSCGNLISGQTWELDPDNPDPRRVATGESALFRVQVAKRRGKTTILHVEPHHIVNYKHPEYGMIVADIEAVLEDKTISQPWKRFYRYRVPSIRTMTADNSIFNILR
jgi:poly-gamma-glutamate synthesis protein (capsule biosynthesis protein)